MKVRVLTTITQQPSYSRCDDFIKTKTFDENERIAKIRDYIESLKPIQMEGTVMSPITIEFIDNEE